MPYTIIVLEGSVPESIGLFVSERVEPYLRDVRRMLELPVTEGQAGFNLTAAGALFGIIGGLSRIFYRRIRSDGESFQKTAAHYRLADEPRHAVRNPVLFAAELYEVYRCNLVHSLGLSVEWSQSSRRREIVELDATRKVGRQLPFTSAQFDEIETSTARPDWLSPTLWNDGRTVRLCVEPLYRGVRGLVKTLAETESLKDSAEEFLQPWFVSRRSLRAAAPEHAVMSSTPSEGLTTMTTREISATVGAMKGSPTCSLNATDENKCD